MATNNQINLTLSGVTGTGNVAATNSPTFVTPALGAATGTSISFSSTAGLIGTTTNDNADAGSVGEYISSSVLIGSAVALTTATPANVTSISLTAGDWDVSATIYFSINAATTSTIYQGGISTSSATLPTAAAENNSQLINFTFAAGMWPSIQLGVERFSLSGTTTVYLVTDCTFAVNTLAAYGFIGARRRR